MLAYDYPLGGVLLTMLYFFLFVIWIWILITVFADIFRSHDLSGWAKALWSIFVIIIPFLGVFISLIARGGRCRNARSKTLLSRSCPSTLQSERQPAHRVGTSHPSSLSCRTSKPKAS